ncbi:MAG: ribonuclease E/G [Acidocella sp. 20-61-6]|nr:MAG: ribonuclease E/G [Acidocella sp. 20-61-6]
MSETAWAGGAESVDSDATEATEAQALNVTAIEIVSAPPPEESQEPVALAAEEAASENGDVAQAEAGAEKAELEVADEAADETTDEAAAENGHADSAPEAPAPESLGGDGDDAAEARERRQRQRFLKNYKIQDVIHRRQIMLIQVVKEERGNKGAALTTYLSLAGRFSVLMPNSPSGGGVSRKITSVADRRRLKEAVSELEVPDGMGLIVRTAGANRPKPEIKRDCEYLLRLWDDIRERTFESTAPALIYEEANLIKRTIRDVYTRDVDEVLVDGAEGHRAAQDFMRMLMPSHAKKVQLWTEGQPLFAKYQVEAQLDAMLNPIVQLRSGGYIVINQTEALVAIDVNSGRSTRERSIEDTALRTNLEAAEETAKQLRMRDLAGLIVIDFIDMESRKNNTAVERKLKDSLKHDRARIQVGSISHFGLMEMSRQRLRPSVTEASLIICPHCAGMGHVRSPESAALHILRAIEDEGGKFRAAEITVALPPEIAFYLFNHKRERLASIESRYAMRVVFAPDATLTGTNFRIEKTKVQTAAPPVAAPASYAGPMTPERALPAAKVEEESEEESQDADAPNANDTAEEGERKRRRRRRRGKRRSENGAEITAAEAGEGDALAEAPTTTETPVDEQPSEIDLIMAAELGEPGEEAPVAEEEPGRRRRARGGRRRKVKDGEEAPAEAPAPAEPFYADVADIFEAAERAAEAQAHERALARQNAASVTQPLVEAEPPVEAVVEVTPESAPEPIAEAATPPTAELSVKPIVVGGQDVPVPEKKRGWWRR